MEKETKIIKNWQKFMDSNWSDNVLKDIRSKVKKDQKIVFVSGNFNIVHPGHLRLLNYAAECGDFLVVGVNLDGPAQDIYIESELRLESIRSLEMVDYAFPLVGSAADFIQHLKPAFVIKGKEYEGRTNPEQSVLDSYGGRLMFSSGDVRFSSMDLVRKELSSHSHQLLDWPMEYTERHKITSSGIKKILENFADKKIVVIGDLIIDEYVMCNALGMSQEDPTLVVTPVMSQTYLGGAAIVAAHARGMGADVKFFSVVGADESASEARKKLIEYNVDAHLYEDNSRPTTTKTRYRTKNKTLLRVNRLSQNAIEADLSKKILKGVIDVCAQADAVIFSDFSYGCMPQPLVDQLVEHCKENNIHMFGDSQCSSQIGDVSRFKNMHALTPTEREARLALHDFNSGLVVLAENLMQKSLAKNVIMTLGEEGILIYSGVCNGLSKTDLLPALNPHPKDVSGAGDSFLTALSLACVSGADIWQGCFLASIASGLQVSRVGNLPLSFDEMYNELERRQ